MPTVFTPVELKARFTGQKRSLVYDEALDLYNKIRVHADGETPILLIKKARPNESEEVRAYRQDIYESETQNPVERVLGVLEKIRRSPDWMMLFDEEVPPIINKDETPKKYLTEKYPIYQDIEYWIFEELLRTLSLDANAVVAVMPNSFMEPDPTEYMQPIAKIYTCKNVVDFIPNDYVILRSDELSSQLNPDQQQTRINSGKATIFLTDGQEIFVPGQVYYIITISSYQKWEETPEGKYILTANLPHNLNSLPAFQMPGKFVKRVGNYTLKKTPLNPMVPHLNKAARESNDLDAGVIMHLYLEKWRINNIPCNKCNGTGSTLNNGERSDCTTCKGTGWATGKSPFNEIIIRPAAIGDQAIPTPPVGYVDKNPEILKIQNERIEQHIYKAMCSVNMDHLADAQLNQSGTAKAYDRDEVNNTIYTFASMLTAVTNQVVKFIIDLRYSGIIASQEERTKLYPVIPVPEKYDVINSSFLINEYQVAKTAGLNGIILAEMQKEIGNKKFYANPKVSAFVQTVMDLDPFPDKTTEEKGAMQAQKLATTEDVVLSNYISDFVRRAQDEDPNFNSKTDIQKREVLNQYAVEKVAELDTAAEIAQDIFEPGSGQPPGQQPLPGQPAPGQPAPGQPMPPTNGKQVPAAAA
jgi:hypothetical protein